MLGFKSSTLPEPEGFVLGACCFAIVLVSAWLLLWRRNAFPVSARWPRAVFGINTLMVPFCAVWLANLIWPESVPCIVHEAATLVFFPLVVAFYLVRAAALLFHFEIAKDLLRIEHRSKHRSTRAVLTINAPGTPRALGSARASPVPGFGRPTPRPFIRSGSMLMRSGSTISVMPKHWRPNWYTTYRHWLRPWRALVYVFLPLFLLSSAAVLSGLRTARVAQACDDHNRVFVNTNSICLYALTLVEVGAMVVLASRLRKHANDSFGMLAEFTALAVTLLLSFALNLVAFLLVSDVRERLMLLDLLMVLTCTLCAVLSSLVPVFLSQRHLHSVRSRQRNLQRITRVNELLADPLGFQLFLRFCTAEFTSENVLCFRRIEELRSACGVVAPAANPSAGFGSGSVGAWSAGGSPRQSRHRRMHTFATVLGGNNLGLGATVGGSPKGAPSTPPAAAAGESAFTFALASSPGPVVRARAPSIQGRFVSPFALSTKDSPPVSPDPPLSARAQTAAKAAAGAAGPGDENKSAEAHGRQPSTPRNAAASLADTAVPGPSSIPLATLSPRGGQRRVRVRGGSGSGSGSLASSAYAAGLIRQGTVTLPASVDPPEPLSTTVTLPGTAASSAAGSAASETRSRPASASGIAPLPAQALPAVPVAPAPAPVVPSVLRTGSVARRLTVNVGAAPSPGSTRFALPPGASPRIGPAPAHGPATITASGTGGGASSHSSLHSATNLLRSGTTGSAPGAAPAPDANSLAASLAGLAPLDRVLAVLQEANDILETYVVDDAPFELNLSSADRQAAQDALAQIATDLQAVAEPEQEKAHVAVAVAVAAPDRNARQARYEKSESRSDSEGDADAVPPLLAAPVMMDEAQANDFCLRIAAVFDKVLTVIVGLMQVNSYPRFRLSPLFDELLAASSPALLQHTQTQASSSQPLGVAANLGRPRALTWDSAALNGLGLGSVKSLGGFGPLANAPAVPASPGAPYRVSRSGQAFGWR